MPKSRLLGRVLRKDKPQQVVFLCRDKAEQERLRAKAKQIGTEIAFIQVFKDPRVKAAIELGGMVTYYDALPEELAVHVREDDMLKLRRFTPENA